MAGHLALCATCSYEFDRVKKLLDGIDRSVANTVNVDPSPRLVPQLRQRLSQPSPRTLLGSWLPAAAGSLVAASLLVLLLRPQTAQPHGSSSRQPTPEIAGLTPASPTAAATTLAPHIPTNITSSVSRSPNPESRGKSSEILESNAPQTIEVIVPPGEWQAVTGFAAAVSHRQISLGESDESIEVKEDLPMFAFIEVSRPQINQMGVEDLPEFMRGR